MQANQWEVNNARETALLCENGTSYRTDGRLRRDYYKGMSQQEIDKIHTFNAQMAEEKKENERLCKEEGRQWAAGQVLIDSELIKRESEDQAWKTSQRYELADDHVQQRIQHQQREKFLKKEIGEGGVNNGFYSQFNRTIDFRK